jgi:hypothetical protein
LVFVKPQKIAMKAKKKYYMWYKVKELSEKGHNKSQISQQTGLDRATIRKYLIMNEEEFQLWINNPRHLPHKLSPSTRIHFRGYSSLQGNNQPLIIVDGVPIN